MSGKLHIFSGSDDFSVKDRANRFMAELCGPNPEDNPALEIIRGDSDTENFAQILDSVINSVTTPPFLSPEKIIWLKHFDKYEDAFGECSGKKKKGRLDILGDIFKAGIMDGVTVVIDGSGLDRKRTFYKICADVCAKNGSIEFFEKLDPKSKNFSAGMFRVVQELFEREGRKISPDAATFLSESSGGDLVRLRNETEKLISYAGDASEITLDDCHAVCSVTEESLAWEFSSALVEKNPEKAVKLLPGIAEVLQQNTPSGNPYVAIVASVSNEFNRLLSVKCEAERCGIGPRARYNDFLALSTDLKERGVKNIFSSMHPFRAFKLWESSARFSPVEIADAFDAISEANLGIVTGSDGSMLLEMLAIRVTGRKK